MDKGPEASVYLERGKFRVKIAQRLISFAGSSNGRTAAFEAVYLGPNPSPAANGYFI